MVPDFQWPAYDAILRELGRGDTPTSSASGAYPFLEAMKLVEAGQLTQLGQSYFRHRFVLREEETANGIIRDRLTQIPAVALICQVFHGRGAVSRVQAENLLRQQGIAANRVAAGRLLRVLNKFGIVRYSSKTDGFVVLREVALTRDLAPSHVYVAPQTPYSNVQRLREIVSTAVGDLWWLDKHFDRKGFPLLADAVNSQKVPSVTLVSGPANVDSAAKTDFGLLLAELRIKGTQLRWSVVPANQLRDIHDRWLLCDDWAYNVPPVNSLFTAQAADISRVGDIAAKRDLVQTVAARGSDLN